MKNDNNLKVYFENNIKYEVKLNFVGIIYTIT